MSTARAVWVGAIQIGCVYIPISLYTASRETRPHFKRLHAKCVEKGAEDASLTQEHRCKACAKTVDGEDLVSGFEVDKTRIVPIPKDVIELAKRPQSPSIVIGEFVNEGMVDPSLFTKAYYVAPTAIGEHAFATLYGAIDSLGVVGLGLMTRGGTERLIAVRTSLDGVLMLHDMLYASEVVEAPSRPAAGVVRAKEAQLARSLVRLMTSTFKHDAWKDAQTEETIARVTAHINKSPAPPPRPETKRRAPEVGDLAEVLRRSIQDLDRGAA